MKKLDRGVRSASDCKTATVQIGLEDILFVLRREGYLTEEALGFALPTDLMVLGARVDGGYGGRGCLNIAVESDGLPEKCRGDQAVFISPCKPMTEAERAAAPNTVHLTRSPVSLPAVAAVQNRV